MIKTILLAFVLLLCCCPLAFGQDISGGEDIQSEIFNLRQGVKDHRVLLTRLNVSTTKQAAEVDTSLAQTSANIAFLIKTSTRFPVPREYAESFSEDTLIIRSIRAMGTIGDSEWKRMESVEADLKVKAIHAERMLERKAHEAPFDSIEIIVHTRKNGKEVGDYQVWYVKEAYQNEPGRYQTFDRFSSPASRKIPPGKYVMWTQATDGSKAQGEKTPKEFGDGQSSVETDLTAP